jgi:hypothetical protein
MTRAHKLRAAIIVVTALGAVTVFVLLITQRSQARPLSLLFERYGTVTTMDLFAQDVAFFWITNSTDKTYGLPMTGSTNTHLPDAPIAFSREQSSSEGSYLVMYEFRDQTPTGSTHPPVSFASLGRCLTLGPHSAVRLRVALPPDGQKRRVAVLFTEQPQGPRRFWTNGIGLSILRTLPRSVGRKLLFSQPAVQRVWCDRELSHDGERLEKR